MEVNSDALTDPKHLISDLFNIPVSEKNFLCRQRTQSIPGRKWHSHSVVDCASYLTQPKMLLEDYGKSILIISCLHPGDCGANLDIFTN